MKASSIPESMQALQLMAVKDVRRTVVSTPSPAPDEVLIRTHLATICTSDLNDIDRNLFGIQLPQVLGHEGCGVVAAIGEEVHGFGPGDRVAAHPVIPCLECRECQRGLQHLCSNMGHLGIDRPGVFGEYFAVRADRVRKIPDALPWAAASLLEPVCVCLQAVNRGRVEEGDSVLIVGDGPFGLLIARLALLRKPRNVIVVGRHDFRLRQFEHCLQINDRKSTDVVSDVLAANGGDGVDVAILAAGRTEALDLCMKSLRRRGRTVVFSAIDVPAPTDFFQVHVKELEILGACNDEDLIDDALGILAGNSPSFGSLVTHEIPFSRWREALELAQGGKDEALKVALTFEEFQ